MLDDRETEAGATCGTGAGRVDAVEALEDALLVLVRDADALVGHGDLDVVPARCGEPACGDADAGSGGRVVDGVLDEVAERRGQLAPVAPDAEVLGAAGGHVDLLRAGGVPAAVDRLGDELVHADGFGVLQRVVVLHPGEVDELLHQVGEPGRLDLHAPGEALHGLRVVGGVHDRLGQQGESADRCLQLMAHVRDEVAPYRLYAPGLGEVLDEEQYEPGAEGGHPGGDGEGLAAAGAAPGQVQLDLPYLAVAPGVPGHLEHGFDGELAAAHQTEGVRRRAGLDDGVPFVEDHRRGAQHRQDRVHAGWQDRVGVQGGPGGSFQVAFAPAERQHGDDAGENPGDRCRCGDRRVHVHAPRLGMARAVPTAVGVRARTLVAQSSPWSQYWFIWGGGNGRVETGWWGRGVRTASSARRSHSRFSVEARDRTGGFTTVRLSFSRRSYCRRS